MTVAAADGVVAPTARRVLVGSATVLASRVVTSAIAVVKGMGVAALVPPATFGVLSLVTTVVMYGGWAQLGVRAAATRKILLAEATGDKQTAAAVQRAGINLNGVLVAGYAAVVAGAALFGGVSGDVRLGLLAAIPLLCLAALGQWYETRALADGAFRAVGGGQIVQAAFGALAVVGGTYVAGLPGLLVGLVLAQAASVAVLALAVPLRLGGGLRRAEAMSLLRAGMPFFGGGLAFMLLRSADNLLVFAFLDNTAWGLYSFALMVSLVVVNITNECTRVLNPFAQRAVAHGDAARLRPYVIPPSLLGAVAVPFIAGIAHHVLPALVATMFPHYRGAVDVVDALFVGVFFYVITVFHGTSLMAIGREGTLAGLRLLSAMVTLGVGATVLQAGWGLPGVALASALGWAVNAGPTIVASARRMGLARRVVVRYVAALLAPLVYGAAGVVVTGALRPEEPSLGAVLSAALAFAAWYVPAVLWLGLRLNAGEALRRRSWASIVVPFDHPITGAASR